MSLSVSELNPKPSINDSYIKDTERSDIWSSIKKETSQRKPITVIKYANSSP